MHLTIYNYYYTQNRIYMFQQMTQGSLCLFDLLIPSTLTHCMQPHLPMTFESIMIPNHSAGNKMQLQLPPPWLQTYLPACFESSLLMFCSIRSWDAAGPSSVSASSPEASSNMASSSTSGPVSNRLSMTVVGSRWVSDAAGEGALVNTRQTELERQVCF